MIKQNSNVISVQPIDLSKATEAERHALKLFQNSETVIVRNEADKHNAVEFVKTIKQAYKDLEAKRKELVNPLNAVKNTIQSMFRDPLDKLTMAENTVKKSILRYEEEQERIRREEQRKAEEKARREEEEKRRRLNERADRWEEKGKADKAESLRQEAEETVVQPPVVQSGSSKVEGTSIRETWKAEVTDLKALVVAVAEGRAPMTFIQANMTAINKTAVSMKDTMQFPGVRFYADKSLAVSTR